jgi:hypothetical protein
MSVFFPCSHCLLTIAVMVDPPVGLDERARALIEFVKGLPRVDDPMLSEADRQDVERSLGVTWPFLDRLTALSTIVDAAKSNLAYFEDEDIEKMRYKVVVITAAAGTGKTRLCKEAMCELTQTMRTKDVKRVYSVLITFLNGEQITSDDNIGGVFLASKQASIALGIRIACKLFPALGLCSARALNDFRSWMQSHMLFLDLRTVMRAVRLSHADLTAKETVWITVTLDEVHFAEMPQHQDAPLIWSHMMTELLGYVIPGEAGEESVHQPMLVDRIVLFPMLSSTWSNFRKSDYVSPADKVFPILEPLSHDSVSRLCSQEELDGYMTPTLTGLLAVDSFRTFLLTCAQAPRALARAIECASSLNYVDTSFAIKSVCQELSEFYKRGTIGAQVLEFAFSGVRIPLDVDNVSLDGFSISHWLRKGFATGAEGTPMAVTFPLLYNEGGNFIVGVDQFLNYGQPFHWQHFEALVPHIVSSRCASLRVIKPIARIDEIFGSGPPIKVKLQERQEVVTCSEQWLTKGGRGGHSLKVSEASDKVKIKRVIGDDDSISFGSPDHVFAAADGNVHFDGHCIFELDAGGHLLVLLQTKYTRIKHGQDASHFAWCAVSEWFECARKYTDPFKGMRKLFVFVTNKEVRDCPDSLDSDCVVIRQDNLHTFFAPCLLASARLAQSAIDST